MKLLRRARASLLAVVLLSFAQVATPGMTPSAHAFIGCSASSTLSVTGTTAGAYGRAQCYLPANATATVGVTVALYSGGYMTKNAYRTCTVKGVANCTGVGVAIQSTSSNHCARVLVNYRLSGSDTWVYTSSSTGRLCP